MRRKNLWLRLSSCTMAALLATTSVTPTFGADFASEVVVESQQEETTAEEEGSQVEVGDDFQNEDIANVATDETDADVADDSEETAVFSDEENAAEEVFSDEAGEEAATTFEFGTARTKLEKGSYTVKVSLMNASNPENASMAGSCIAGDATMVVAEDGSAKVTVPIQAVSVYGMTGNASQWKVYKGDLKSDKTDAEFTTDANGKVNSITYTVPDKTADGAYVNMYVDMMSTTVDAFLKLDYANAVKQAPTVDTSALEATIAKADALEEMSYTKASWDGNKDAIETAKTAAKAVLEAKESQEAVDNANTALTTAMGKLVKAGDLKGLQQAIDDAKAVDETLYTVKSVNSMKEKITAAEKVLEERGGLIDVIRAKANVNSAVKSLVKAYGSEKLQNLIDKAETLKEEDYTSESWKAADLVSAVAAAKDAIEARGDKEDIQTATNTLENAMDALVENSIVVGRGNFVKKLAPGTYSLPIELLNGGHAEATKDYTSADYLKHTSMAAGCFTGNATLVIHEDGTATLTTGVQAISAMGMTGAASDWTIYENTQDYLDGKANSSHGARFKARVDESKVQAGKKKPSKISFTIPDLKQNVVATNMYIEVMTVYQDACIGLDWAHVEKVSDDTSATSTVEKEYVVKADTMTQLTNMKAGTTVKLDEDVTLTDDLTIKGGTLDLNGHALNQADNLIRIKGDVTIIDSSAEKTGKITRELYYANGSTTTSVSVEKGSLTAEGVTIDGQVGNKVKSSTSITMNNPRVSVKLSNCTLLNSVGGSSYVGGNMNVAFAYLDNGVDVELDHCTADSGVYVGHGTNESTVITNSELKQIDISGKTAVVENTTTTEKASVSASEMKVQNNTFGGLSIGGDGDVVLENITSTNASSGVMGGALSVDGTGKVTVRNCVFTNAKGYAVTSLSAPIEIESGYFKGTDEAIYGAYITPEGKVLGDVTEGEYTGYKTVVDGTEEDIQDPVAVIYNADGSVAKKISDKYSDRALTYAKDGQTVKLEKDAEIDGLSFYRNCTLDLNGHLLTLTNSLTGGSGTCRIIDSSAEKTGKIKVDQYFYNGNAENAVLILDAVTCETTVVQAISTGKLYVTNGTKMIGAALLNPFMGGGLTYVQDSSWVIAETDLKGDPVDADALLENSTRTSQYTITKTGDRTYTVTANDLGKAMRAFEAVDASLYTKASYEAAKAIYTEMDESADEDVTAEVVAEKSKALNDAVAALQAAATEADITALNEAITAAKAVKSGDYTTASYKTLSDAVSAAETLLAGDDLAQADATAAVQAINDATAALVKLSAQKITVTSKYSKKLSDKAFSLNAKATGKLTYKSSNTKVATVDSKGKVTLKGVGTATITVSAAASGNYKAASAKVTIKVAKGTPTIKVKTTSKTLKVATVKKKAQKIALGASVNSKGKMSFKKVSGNKAITVNTKTGALTVKKGLKKGTYKVKVQITSKATGSYNAGKKTVTVTVRVK